MDIFLMVFVYFKTINNPSLSGVKMGIVTPFKSKKFMLWVFGSFVEASLKVKDKV